MISDVFLGIVFGLAQALLDLLPVWSPPEGLPESASLLGVQFDQLNEYAPVALLGLCLLVVLAYKLLLSAWRLVVFVYDRFPFKAT